MKNLVKNLQGAIGSKYLKNHNQLIFVEYGGFLSRLDLVQPSPGLVSHGTTVIDGTFLFDCETGTMVSPGASADIWWEQIDPIKRQMTPVGNAQIVNLGHVNFAQLTPAVMQSFNYSSAPIDGNNDATNKLVPGDVFCVKTREGNIAKIEVITYGYNIKIQWATYKLDPAYAHIGTGYTEPEDIFVLANEQTAYVTERTGDLVKVNLSNANRNAATVVCTGLNSPQQLWVDEVHQKAYVVEYAAHGNLLRIDLATGVKTILYNGLNYAVGLIVSADLAFAYVTEQGLFALTRINLTNGVKTTIAAGLTAPFFLTWADDSETRLLVPERDPANRVSIVDISQNAGNVHTFIPSTGFRPSSITVINPGTYCVATDQHIEEYDLTANTANFLYKGIGYVAWNLIPANGKADTTSFPAYPYQFPKDSPFGGSLPVNIDHYHAWNSGIRYYRVLIDGVPRHDSWTEVRMDPSNGYYDILETKIADNNGFYYVHNPVYSYLESDLGCLLDSTTLSNALHHLAVEFYDASHVSISTMGNALLINNQGCVALMDMPALDGHAIDANCGYLKYNDPSHLISLHWAASQPMGFATYSYSIVKGAYGFDGLSGALYPATLFDYTYSKTVAAMLGTCPGVAAFYESLYVASTIINGVSRQSQYDASQGVAFCLAP
jgi:hypothetical protein